MSRKSFSVYLMLLVISAMALFSISSDVYAKNTNFHSPCFNISLPDNLKLALKDEKKGDGFYLYVFSAAGSNDDALQIRVIVSKKQPEAGQSLEDFQTASIGAMSVMFIDTFKLYQYLNIPENKKTLGSKPYKLKLGNASLAGATMYLGNIDVSFLVTRPYDMTYAFTLVSRSNNEQTRKDHLKLLTEQLQSIEFLSCSE